MKKVLMFLLMAGSVFGIVSCGDESDDPIARECCGSDDDDLPPPPTCNGC